MKLQIVSMNAISLQHFSDKCETFTIDLPDGVEVINTGDCGQEIIFEQGRFGLIRKNLPGGKIAFIYTRYEYGSETALIYTPISKEEPDHYYVEVQTSSDLPGMREHIESVAQVGRLHELLGVGKPYDR